MLALLLDFDIHNTNFLNSKIAQEEAMKKWLSLASDSEPYFIEYKKYSHYKIFKNIFNEIIQSLSENKILNLKSYY